MIVFISDTFNKKVMFIAYYQIIGGIIGILLTFWELVNIESGSLLLLGALGLYTFSVLCGKLLIDGKIEKGLRHSTINQAIQTINFKLIGFAFNFIAGFNLSVGIDYTSNLKFNYNLSLSQFNFAINGNNELVKVGINLIALSLIFTIGNMMIEFKQERKKLNNDPVVNEQNATPDTSGKFI